MAALVKQHKEKKKDREKKEKQEAKGAGNIEVARPAPTPAPKQWQKQARADATGRQLETTGAVPVVSSGLLATGQHTTLAKKGRTNPSRQNADQDAQDM